MTRVLFVLLLLIQTGCDSRAADPSTDDLSSSDLPVENSSEFEGRMELDVLSDVAVSAIDVSGLSFNAPTSQYFEASPMMIRGGEISWIEEKVSRSESELQRFEYATDVLAQMAPLTAVEGKRVFVGDENGNKVVYFEGHYPGNWIFRMTYDPARKALIRRTAARD